MKCERVAEIEESYLLGELEETEMGEVERHLKNCLRCAQRIAGYEDLLGRMFVALEPVTPAPSIRKAVLAEAQVHPNNPQPISLPHKLPVRRAAWSSGLFSPVFGAVAAALVLALAAWSIFLYTRLQDTSARPDVDGRLVDVAAAPDTLIWDMSSPNNKGSYNPNAPRARMYAKPGNDLYLLTATKMQPAPTGKVYVAWYAVNDKVERGGTLTPDASGNASLQIEDDQYQAGAITGCFITVEAADGNPLQPTAPPILEWKRG
ncbi:MAG TPA: anti-sigma factor [Chloroflexia bacterium]|nr:anti-sigma factor [Chloroflexia bacterium]